MSYNIAMLQQKHRTGLQHWQPWCHDVTRCSNNTFGWGCYDITQCSDITSGVGKEGLGRRSGCSELCQVASSRTRSREQEAATWQSSERSLLHAEKSTCKNTESWVLWALTRTGNSNLTKNQAWLSQQGTAPIFAGRRFWPGIWSGLPLPWDATLLNLTGKSLCESWAKCNQTSQRPTFCKRCVSASWLKGVPFSHPKAHCANIFQDKAEE